MAMPAVVTNPCPEKVVTEDLQPRKLIAEEAADSPIAVIICHGMGQQAPFETLNGACALLENGSDTSAANLPGRAPWKWKLQSSEDHYVQLGEQYLPRSVLTFAEPVSGEKRVVHVYESYWAPLAEAAITLPETVAFLFGSAFRGILHCLASPDGFNRWLFGGKKWLRFSSGGVSRSVALILLLLALVGLVGSVFPDLIPGSPSRSILGGSALVLLLLALFLGVNRTTRHLTAAALVFGSMVMVNTITALAAARLFSLGGNSGGLSLSKLPILTGDLGFGMLLFVAFGGTGMVMASLARKAGKTVPSWIRLPARWLVWLGLGVLIGLGGLMALHLLTALPPVFPKLEQAWMMPIWGAAVVLSAFVRRFLLQYLGDVAVYASSHTVNRFCKTRQEIREVGRKVVGAVFAAADEQGQLRYQKVLLVGHSLGSVVAYDSWNSAMNDDLLQNRKLDVAGRTALFLTFGSPLDKFAFLFRNQMSKWFEHREALAASVQPAIVNVDRRPQRWVNVWTPDDWISGDLNYYDDPKPGPNEAVKPPRWSASDREQYRVVNLKDPEACTPGASHNEYWQNTLLPRILFSAVIGKAELEDEIEYQETRKH